MQNYLEEYLAGVKKMSNFKRNTFILLFILMSFGQSLMAKEKNRLKIENLFTPSRDATTYISLNYQNIGSKIAHNESSDVAGYAPLGEKSDIGQHTLGLELAREFYARGLFSFNLMGRIGINKGTDKKSENVNVVNFKDKASGKHYGAGLSLNLNTEGFGLKIQPFISGQYLFYKTDYELEYKTDAAAVNIKYASDNRILQHSIGMRFINERQRLMSFISLDYFQNLEEDLSVSGTQGANDLKLSNTAQVQKNDIAFTIGFGFLF